jgi:hypothetical protein
MHAKHLLEHFIQSAALLDTEAHGPFPGNVVWEEWVRKPVIKSARTAIAEAEWEEFEVGDGLGKEAPSYSS